MSKPQQSCCTTNSNLVMQESEIKVPLPFLGRSQSLLNIPLDLNKQLITTVEPKVAAVVQQQQAAAVPSIQPPMLTAPQPARRTTGATTKRSVNKTDAKYQSLPHSVKEGQHKAQHRREGSSTMPHPVRSKSVEAKSAQHQQQQQQYDISQLELFAAIHQSRQAVSSRSNSKNLTVTSALVGVRQSDRNGTSRGSSSEQKNGKMSGVAADPVEKSVSSTAKNPSGHVCVVQALVHQDGDVVRNSAAATHAEASARIQRSQRTWEPVYEPLAGPHVGRPTKTEAETSEASIELTADQVRQLIRAISAAQSNSAGSIGGCWSSEMNRPPVNSSQIPERDVAVTSKQPLAHRNIHRNDSFEGHEEAVRMLVGAIQEIQQLCTDKKHDSN